MLIRDISAFESPNAWSRMGKSVAGGPGAAHYGSCDTGFSSAWFTHRKEIRRQCLPF
jgi:hypothetical protein